MEKSTILKIENLTKKYGKIEAVRGVSFEMLTGEVIGLLGPNGAGKTTIINMILGILEPTKGKIEIFGKNMKEKRSEITQQMNFSAIYARLPDNMTVRQNLLVFGKLYSVKNLEGKIRKLIKEFDLERFADTKAGLLSSGEISRLNLAKAIINDPCLLLLDEPTASLDPSIAQMVREKIKDYIKKTDAAVLWTSHNMYEIEAVCDRVMFLSQGKILLSGDPKTLPGERKKKNLEELFISIAREPLSQE